LHCFVLSVAIAARSIQLGIRAVAFQRHVVTSMQCRCKATTYFTIIIWRLLAWPPHLILGCVQLAKIGWKVTVASFVVIWQNLFNHGLIRLKRFVSTFTDKLYN
jgi:hypothetical protein